MVQDIVFHLGDCKTGTTSIQSALAHQSWTHPSATVCYPAQVNHIPLAKTLTTDSEKPFEAKRFSQVVKAFRRSDARHGVISAEHFEFVDPHLVDKAIKKHFGRDAAKVRLVAYVRPHADRFVSTFAERAKKGLFQGSMMRLHERMKNNQFLIYAPRFETWRSLFGERFTLRPFVRSDLYHSDVVEDFLHYLFADDQFALKDVAATNESLSVQDIAMMRGLHKELRELGMPQGKTNEQFGWYMSDLLAAMPYPDGPIKPAMPKGLAREFTTLYAEDAARLDEVFFQGTPMSDALQAAPDKAVAKGVSFQAEDHFNAVELRQIKVWAQMLHRLMAADPEHFNWAVRSPDHRSDQPPRNRA